MADNLEELEKKFPEVPKSIIYKADVLVRGVNRSPALEEVGRWALPQCKYWCNPTAYRILDAG